MTPTALHPRTRACAAAGAFLLIAVAAFLFRLPGLDKRPLHTDEAVHTYKAGELFEQGVYQYDRHDYHGPTIYLFAYPFVRLGGASTLAETDEWVFRIVPVIFGTALILLLPLAVDGIGIPAALIAALLLCASPAFVFYSRYYIQEIPLVFFTFLFIAACWRYIRSGRLAWVLTAGVAAGLMQATKETSVLAWTAMAIAAAATIAWAATLDRGRHDFKPRIVLWHIPAAAAVAVLLAVFLLTNFFRNPQAIVEAFATYFAYLDRSKGATPHDHPFLYYLQLLAWTREGRGPWWSEGLILGLASVGMIAGLAGRGFSTGNVHFLRFFSIYTPVLTLIYCAIPYKTPWCALTFLHGMTILAGLGAVVILNLLRYKTLQAIFLALVLAGVAQSAAQARRANDRFCADTRNPYVYGHTSTNLLRLVDRVNEIAKLAPEGRASRINVITPDQWPLPWYLRAFSQVAYYPDVPERVDASIVIAADTLQEAVESKMRDQYQSEIFQLRPAIFITLYIRKDLWDAYMAAKTAGSNQP